MCVFGNQKKLALHFDYKITCKVLNEISNVIPLENSLLLQDSLSITLMQFMKNKEIAKRILVKNPTLNQEFWRSKLVYLSGFIQLQKGLNKEIKTNCVWLRMLQYAAALLVKALIFPHFIPYFFIMKSWFVYLATGFTHEKRLQYNPTFYSSFFLGPYPQSIPEI